MTAQTELSGTFLVSLHIRLVLYDWMGFFSLYPGKNR